MTRLSRRHALLLLAAMTVAPVVRAAGPAEKYVIELRVIEGERAATGEKTAAPNIDKRLATLAKDLQSLPFKRFTLKDSHTSLVQDGERISLELPLDGQKPGKRFLVVAAHGRQAGGKLRFSLAIEAVKFDTLVAVPDGGTIIVGGPRAKGGNVVLFAFTAKAKR